MAGEDKKVVSPRRVLLLHGKGGSGSKFKDRIVSSSLGVAIGLEGAAEWRSPDGPVPLGEDSFAWWNVPPGQRSFEAEEWLRSEEAIQTAAEAAKGCSVCLGFSQGAMLLAVLLAKGKLPDCGAAVLVGAAWPNPYAADIRDFESRGGRKPHILHVSSEADTINPPEQAKKLHQFLGGDFMDMPELGHAVPLEGPGAEALALWVSAQLDAK